MISTTTNTNHLFPLPLRPRLRLAFPPALSAFSVLLARCFTRSTVLSAFVWYFTFLLDLVFDFIGCSVADTFDFARVFVSTTMCLRRCGVDFSSPSFWCIRGGPCMIVSGSKSSITVTVASCSSFSYSSCSCSGCPC